MKLCVIGTGYVGLVAGACLADMGNDVICVDNNEQKLMQLEQGIIPIYEPGLDELVTSNVSEHRLKFSSNLDDAVKKSEVCFIAVGTPQREDGSADLSSVYSVAEAIAKAMNGYKVIVDKSTVPVGTADEVTQIIRKNTEFDFDVVSNPEFLKQGNAVDDFLAPDRSNNWIGFSTSNCNNAGNLFTIPENSQPYCYYGCEISRNDEVCS